MIYFLSDAHLGYPEAGDVYAHQSKLIALLEQMSKDATAIYMLGDMFHFWMEYYISDPQKRQFTPFFKELRKLKRQGIEIHYFLGDHDQWTFGGIKSLTGVELQPSPCTLTLCGKRVYMDYGEGLLPYNWDQTYSIEEINRIEKAQRAKKRRDDPSWQELFRFIPPSIGNRIGYRWAAKHMPDALPDLDLKEPQIVYAKDEEKHGNHRDYYIFGYRHLAKDVRISDSSRVILLGDCFRQWTYACLDEQGSLVLCHFAEDECLL